MESRKVNWKNVSIVLFVSAFGILIGFIDRVVNKIGPIETLISWTTSEATETGAAWYNTTNEIAMSSTSGFSLLGLIIVVIVAFVIMLSVLGTCRCAA